MTEFVNTYLAFLGDTPEERFQVGLVVLLVVLVAVLIFVPGKKKDAARKGARR